MSDTTPTAAGLLREMAGAIEKELAPGAGHDPAECIFCRRMAALRAGAAAMDERDPLREEYNSAQNIASLFGITRKTKQGCD